MIVNKQHVHDKNSIGEVLVQQTATHTVNYVAYFEVGFQKNFTMCNVAAGFVQSFENDTGPSSTAFMRRPGDWTHLSSDLLIVSIAFVNGFKVRRNICCSIKQQSRLYDLSRFIDTSSLTLVGGDGWEKSTSLPPDKGYLVDWDVRLSNNHSENICIISLDWFVKFIPLSSIGLVLALVAYSSPGTWSLNGNSLVQSGRSGF